jgi:hypothetical protein
MPDLSSFPITQRSGASHLGRLQLYAAPTPNGVKVSIMLEETSLANEPHLRWGGKDDEDKRPQQRFTDESKRLGGVLARPAVQRGLHIPARPA